MYLTYEYLESLAPCSEGAAWFKEKYPDGAELLDVINDPKTRKEFLHWGFEHLRINDEEREAYYKRLNINVADVRTIYESNDVSNSSYVVGSRVVTDSTYVFESSRVTNSENIKKGKFITDANKVYHSSFVTNSERVCNSTNITDSKNIISSEYVVDSHSILNSYMVTDSKYVSSFVPGRSSDISNSSFIFECRGLKNCLFCSSLQNKEYYLFNKYIGEKHFNIISKQLETILNGLELELALNWPEKQIPLSDPELNNHFSKHYTNFPDEFWEWVASLPNYNPLILYEITYQDRLL